MHTLDNPTRACSHTATTAIEKSAHTTSYTSGRNGRVVIIFFRFNVTSSPDICPRLIPLAVPAEYLIRWLCLERPEAAGRASPASLAAW
mmetsp:Transcript_757/g.1969  ORF Transcript_757/g.1969 Transcript_757/m.1969 type:complete len:89 (+) Transcript_757:155-421(+)